MARKRKHKRGKRPAPQAPAPTTAEAPPPRTRPKPRRARSQAERRSRVEAPAFWFGFEVTWAKLVLARVVIFGLLAVDSLLQISHAPRYGAGGFNVAQLPGLDAIAPGRVGYEVGQLVCAYLLVFAAVGVATRVVIPLATAIYAWLYFGSHLDSYQHHYLVALVLLLACFVPWQRPLGAPASGTVRTWAVRLILVQLGVMYLWAAISKLHPAWIDGTTLAGQMTGTMRSLIEGSVGFGAAAKLTLVAELVLAATIWIRRAWIVALPLGVAFHLGILASGLEIGLFAYLMLGFYLLVVPDRVWVTLAGLAPRRLVALVHRARIEHGTVVAWIVALVALGAGIGLAAATRFDNATTAALVLCALPLAAAARAMWSGSERLVASAGLAHLVALGLWLVVDRTSSTAVDYYRFWGGSSRRLGDRVTAERAYTRLREVAPDEPTAHYQLGRLYLDRGDEATGLASLREAQRLEPKRARAHLAEARYLLAKGRTAEALERARAAVAAQPDHPQASALLRQLTGAAAPPAAPGPDDDEAP